MEPVVSLAERLMSQYKDRLSPKQICEEILTVLVDGGLRIGDPVGIDLADEAQQRLALASTGGPPGWVVGRTSPRRDDDRGRHGST